MGREGSQEPVFQAKKHVGMGARVGWGLQKSGNSWKLCCGEWDGDPLG